MNAGTMLTKYEALAFSDKVFMLSRQHDMATAAATIF
jgi:hypothetical protein